jgi:hypothetical protein
LPIANTQEMRREHTDVVFVQTLSQRGGHLWVRRRDGGREAGRSKVTRNEPDPTCAGRRATRNTARPGAPRSGAIGRAVALIRPRCPLGSADICWAPAQLWLVVSPKRLLGAGDRWSSRSQSCHRLGHSLGLSSGRCFYRSCSGLVVLARLVRPAVRPMVAAMAGDQWSLPKVEQHRRRSGGAARCKRSKPAATIPFFDVTTGHCGPHRGKESSLIRPGSPAVTVLAVAAANATRTSVPKARRAAENVARNRANRLAHHFSYVLRRISFRT